MSPRITRHRARLRAAIISALTVGLFVMTVALAAYAAGGQRATASGRPIAQMDFAPPPSDAHSVPGSRRWYSPAPRHRSEQIVDCRGRNRDWTPGDRIQHVCRGGKG